MGEGRGYLGGVFDWIVGFSLWLGSCVCGVSEWGDDFEILEN